MTDAHSLDDLAGNSSNGIVSRAALLAALQVEKNRMLDRVAPRFLRPGDFRPFMGLSRRAIYRLLEKRLVRSVVVKVAGAKSGVRLIEVASVEAYLQAEMAKSDGTCAGKEVAAVSA